MGTKEVGGGGDRTRVLVPAGELVVVRYREQGGDRRLILTVVLL